MGEKPEQSTVDLPTLNEQTIRSIDRQIAHRTYGDIIDLCIDLLLKNLYEEKRELVYQILERITLLCDKSKIISLKVKNRLLVPLLNHRDTWIKTETLIIIEKISRFHAKILLDLVEQLENSLIDPDSNIREITLSIIENLILSVDDMTKNLIFSVIRGLNDDSWRIRIRALKVLEHVAVENRLPRDISNHILEIIANMIEDEDEEVQDTAVENFLKFADYVELSHYLGTLRKLLESNDWHIVSKSIWLIGEIGKDKLDEHIHGILKQLIGDIDTTNLTIQTKIIDAFVKIGKENTTQILDLLFGNLKEIDETYSSLFDICMYLGIDRPERVLTYLFEQIGLRRIEEPLIKKFVTEVLQRLMQEIPDKIEEQVASVFDEFNSTDWRIRERAVWILGVVAYILRQKSISVWIDIRLKELLEVENDPEVLKAISFSIEQVRESVDNIDLIVKEVDQEISLFYQQMMSLQQQPDGLRKKLRQNLRQNEFRETELMLEEEIQKALKKVEKFGNTIYNYRFKRLAVDLIEDWTYSRLDLLEQLSDLKAEIKRDINNEKELYKEQLRDTIEKIKARVDVVRSEIEFLGDLNTQLKELIFKGETEKAKKKLDHLAFIREKIYRLESEIGELWIENLDFKEELKDITVYWVNVKIEAQQLLYAITYNLRDIHSFMESQDEEDAPEIEDDMKGDISYELLMNEFQNLILQSSRSVKEQFERFSVITTPVKNEIRKGNFDHASELLDLTMTQTRTSIEDFNKEIMNLYSQLDSLTASDVNKSNVLRKYMEDWANIKDSLLERAQDFYEDTLDDIFLHRIKSMQEVINPIPLDLMGKKLGMTNSELLDRLFKFIEKDEISGKIKNDLLFLPEYTKSYNKMLYISKRIEIMGSKIHFMVRLENKTPSFLHEMSLLISWPDFLILQSEESHSKFTKINDFPSEGIKVFHWSFRIDKTKTNTKINDQFSGKASSAVNHGKIALMVRYKDMFDMDRSLEKKMDLLVR